MEINASRDFIIDGWIEETMPEVIFVKASDECGGMNDE